MKLEIDFSKLARNFHYRASPLTRGLTFATLFVSGFLGSMLLARVVAVAFGVAMGAGGPVAAFVLMAIISLALAHYTAYGDLTNY